MPQQYGRPHHSRSDPSLLPDAPTTTFTRPPSLSSPLKAGSDRSYAVFRGKDGNGRVQEHCKPTTVLLWSHSMACFVKGPGTKCSSRFRTRNYLLYQATSHLTGTSATQPTTTFTALPAPSEMAWHRQRLRCKACKHTVVLYDCACMRHKAKGMCYVFSSVHRPRNTHNEVGRQHHPVVVTVRVVSI